MKAPDEIYIPVVCGELVAYYGEHPFDGYCDGNIKYLRAELAVKKEELMEWAKEQAAITEKLNGNGAMLKAWNTLINKIESL